MFTSSCQEFDFHHHRPNIVSMVIIKSHQLSSSPQMVIQHDEVRVRVWGCEGGEDEGVRMWTVEYSRQQSSPA